MTLALIPATRLPLRRLPTPFLIGAVGVGVLVLSAVFSLAGLPAPASIVQGAPDVSSVTASASSEPGPVLGPAAVFHFDQTRRRAANSAMTCELGPSWIAPATVAYHGARDQKVVALTFDDGWGGSTLRKLFRVLKEKHVNATFFPVGQAVRHDPTSWRRIANANFPIADHTYDHATLKGQCFAEQRLELSRAGTTYRNLLGVTPLPVMRPPGGMWDDATLAAATSAGEPTIVLWDVDTSDWTGIGSRAIRASALSGGKGSIVVMHTSSMATVRALPRIIHRYRERGFTFVTIGQLLGIPGSVPYPPDEGG